MCIPAVRRKCAINGRKVILCVTSIRLILRYSETKDGGGNKWRSRQERIKAANKNERDRENTKVENDGFAQAATFRKISEGRSDAEVFRCERSFVVTTPRVCRGFECLD